MGGGGKTAGGPGWQPARYIDPVTGMAFEDDPEQFVGGGRSGATKLNEFIANRKAGEQQQSGIAAQEAARKTDLDRSAFQQRFGEAKDTARQGIQQTFQNRGIDYNPYNDQIATAINQSAGNVADLSPTPGGAFAPSMGEDLITQLTSGQQARNLQQFNAQFAPNYADTAISDAWIDPVVSDIVKMQFDPLTQQLENASKRGQLNPMGYEGALKALEGKRTAAGSQIRSLATSELNKDRGLLNEYLGGGRTAAGNAPLGTSFSVDPYVSGAQGIAQRERGAFSGDVLSAVGDTKYADLSELMNAGGAYQGAIQPPVGGQPAADPAMIADINRRRRGVGTQGAF